MNVLRSLAVLLLPVLLLAGCGDGGREGGGDARDSREESSRTSDDEDGGSGDEPLEEAPPVEAPTNPGDRTGVATFSLTPAIRRCMEQAGFTQDAPPTAALAAWRHPSGGRIVVASTDEASVTGGIADEIGRGFRAEVDGSVVVAAPEAPAEAARQCLDA